jgi:aryl-alcohol dehydrogenase-like predicted oxidoreductase
MTREPQLPTIQLGTTGRTVSRLTLGGFHQLEISSEIVGQVVDRFLEYGGNYIESARAYGDGASERKLGEALKGRQDQVVLASKSPHRDYDGMKADIEESLRLLQTDHIDFYFFHCVNELEDIATIESRDGAMRAVQEAIDAGHVGGMGFSSHRPWLYRDALQRLPLSVILIWDSYLEEQNFPEIQREIYPIARAKGVGITAMKPLSDGYLYRSPERALRYALGSGADSLVCGMNSVDHVDQAAAALARGPFSEAERAETLREAVELGNYVCRQCGECPASLMHLFRLEGWYDRQMVDYLPKDPATYALGVRLGPWFQMQDLAREEYAKAAWRADDLDAAAGRVTCPYGIDVPRKVRLVTAKLSGGDPNSV